MSDLLFYHIPTILTNLQNAPLFNKKVELYNFGDHRTRQIKQTYQLGLKRLSSMEQQKKELGLAIKDLKSQLELCKDLLLKRGAGSRDL